MKNFTHCSHAGIFFYIKKTFLSFCAIIAMTTIALSAVTFSLHPANAKICTGGSGSFTVAATGSAALTYQWQESIDGAITWSNITNGGLYSGATGAVLTITGPPSSMDTYRYR